MSLRSTEQRRTTSGRGPARSSWQLAGKVSISLFILWHLFAVAAWNLPYTDPLITTVNPVIRPYMVSTGFMQGWAMFAPDPYALDVYVEARIHYADGSVKTWEFPRMEHLSYWERYQKERWRKYAEVAHEDQYSYLWPPMARYAARMNDTDPHNPPVYVDLIRSWRDIPPPDQAPEQFSHYQFATIQINPEDLH